MTMLMMMMMTTENEGRDDGVGNADYEESNNKAGKYSDEDEDDFLGVGF